jgi:exodeoxyribonuclease VII large subunit
LILKQFIETSFKNIVIKGEVSGVKMASSGHIYFSLKDENAVLNAICWRNVVTKFPLQIKDGMEVICEGNISTYLGRSNYQISVKNIQLAGEGLLLAMLEKRRDKLSKEGLFKEIHKKPLPKLPQKIGIITSLQGAVIKDILHRLMDRFPTHVLVWDVIVQGNEAAGYITEAIEGMNNLPEHIAPPDVIIVARGGGSIEDLWSFNEEIVIRAVYNSKIPIVSAVGHETDTTLIDLVSDMRAPTPTAAAEFTTPDKNEISNTLQRIKASLHRILPAFIEMKQSNLERMTAYLHKNAINLQELEIILQNFKASLKLSFNNICKIYTSRLEYLTLSPLTLSRILQKNKEQLANNSWKMKSLYKNKIDGISNLLHSSRKLLVSYSHKNILKRGFSIIRDNKNNLLRSTQDIRHSNMINIEFHDGKVDVVFETGNKKKKVKKENIQNKLPF